VGRQVNDIPLHIERLVRQVHQLDARYAFLKDQLAYSEDEVTVELLQREMAGLKNQRVTPAGEVAEWLATLPPEQRVLTEAFFELSQRPDQP